MPGVEAATEFARGELVGFRVLRVETEVRKYSDVTFTYIVPVVEVYLATAAGDGESLAAYAPPWSAAPWPLLALMEEAARRGVGAFSAAEARRRGIRWLDLARDPRVRAQLDVIAAELGGQGHVPPALKRFVNADEAQTRWASLRAFARKRGHFLVTNGPYQLDKWTETAVVLSVFRDFSYPLGVGSFDRVRPPASRLRHARDRAGGSPGNSRRTSSEWRSSSATGAWYASPWPRCPRAATGRRFPSAATSSSGPGARWRRPAPPRRS